MNRRLTTAAVSIAATLCCGCGLTATIKDIAGFETVAKKARLQNDGELEVRHGGSMKSVPLKSIASMTIRLNETAIFDNELYYGAEIKLRDGTMLTSAAGAEFHNAKTFVCTGNALCGATVKKGRVCIPLDQLTKVTFK